MISSVEELETRIAFQEQAIYELSTEVNRQQAEIHELQQRLQTLEQQLRTLAPSLVAEANDETPPPHY